MVGAPRTSFAAFVAALFVTACGEGRRAALAQQDGPSTGPADANLATSSAFPSNVSFVADPNAQVIFEVELDSPADTIRTVAVSAKIGLPIAVRFSRTTALDYEILQRPGDFGAPRQGFVAVSDEARARGIHSVEVFEWSTSNLGPGSYALNVLWYRVFAPGGYNGAPSEVAFEVSLATSG